MKRATMKTRILTRFVGMCMVVLALIVAGCDDKATSEADSAQSTKTEAKSEAVKANVVANNLCPIMGSKLDPDNVPASLRRKWNGQTVGFCCAGCPSAWDKLSETDKAKKLKESKTKTK